MILGSESKLGLALFYASLGWLVFPCWWIAHGSCACGGRKGCSPGKHPMTPGGLKSATTDPDQIRAWWGRCLDANIGIRTGPESGIWVLDVDGEKGSSDLARLESKYGPLPETLVAETGGGGRHYFFAWPRS